MAPIDAPLAPSRPPSNNVDIAGAGATPTRATAQTTTPVATPPIASSTSTSASASASASTSAAATSTNTDSIALRSTLRLLMLQRERARNDIQTLEELRLQALDKPVEFIEYIQELAAAGHPTSSSSSSDEESTTTKDLPKPQEIYRCPTIEWQKYHVLGAPLEKLVEEQQRRPMVVPQQMQTGGILGVGAEFGEKISGDGGVMKGRMRLFDGVSQRGGVVGR
ncbi:hypothetical protein P167DRAFT_479038 [Morchella conica CCBAS932]|uniref:Uncharacterized protein n=1 Tax=Morchella conica CCBAS932 TaxID=1392247 RepID=A0A3N4LA12_9PEZI|nr:hypothetical protein P167DRAFT_479038 [Morchella conica CCBAS932]